MPPFGSASRKWNSWGTLKRARCARQCALSSCAVAVGARLEDDDRDRRLAEPLVGGRDHGALQDRRVRRERVLHVDRRDVLAAADDHVLRAVLDQDVARLVERRHVARVEPAVADRGRRRVRVAVVADHDRVAADDDLADLLAVGPHVVAVGVHDPHRDAGDRPAGHRLALARRSRRLRRRSGRRAAGRSSRSASSPTARSRTTASTPSSSSSARTSAGEAGEPPMMTWRRLERS